jgi:outer membrane receptor protein involved in Fe transport
VPFSYVGERVAYGVGLSLGSDGPQGENIGEDFFILNPYTTVDLGFTYHPNFFDSSTKLQLMVNNLLDENYYTSILGGTRFNPAAGRSIVGRIGLEF